MTMIISHSPRRSPRNKSRITTLNASNPTTAINAHSRNGIPSLSFRFTGASRSPKKRARKSTSDTRTELSSPTPGTRVTPSLSKISLRTRRSTRLSMSASTGATSLVPLHSHASMKHYGEDSSPPASPTPIVMDTYPDMHRASSPLPGGIPVPSPLGFGFALPGGDTKSQQDERIIPPVIQSGSLSHPQTRSQTRPKPNLSVRIPHPSSFFVGRRSSSLSKPKPDPPVTSRGNTPCPSPLLNPQFKHLIPTSSSSSSLSNSSSTNQSSSRTSSTANTPRSLTPQLPITPLEQVMRPPSAPPPLNLPPIVRPPRNKKSPGTVSPDVSTPMELTFGSVVGTEIEVDIGVLGAVHSPTEMDMDVDLEPPVLINLSSAERQGSFGLQPGWGNLPSSSSLTSHISTQTQIFSTHSIVSHSLHHSHYTTPPYSRAQTPNNSNSNSYLSPLASPYEIPSPPSQPRPHLHTHSPSTPFIKKLSGLGAHSSMFSPNLRSGAGTRPSPLVRSMSLSGAEQDLSDRIGVIGSELGSGLGLIVEGGEGESVPNLGSESEKGGF